MVISTKYKATNIKTYFLVFAFVTIALIVILFFTDFVKIPELPYVVIGIGLLVYLYVSAKRFMYIQFNDEGDKIILRYFKIIPSTLDHHAIEIPKKTFVRFHIQTSLLGLREEIVLVQQTKNGIAKYPPVSISILDTMQKRELKESLAHIAKQNKG
jgi:hypothetical protein